VNKVNAQWDTLSGYPPEINEWISTRFGFSAGLITELSVLADLFFTNSFSTPYVTQYGS
jgi:hypothetical protein